MSDELLWEDPDCEEWSHRFLKMTVELMRSAGATDQEVGAYILSAQSGTFEHLIEVTNEWNQWARARGGLSTWKCARPAAS
jgi:hypothetical protein